MECPLSIRASVGLKQTYQSPWRLIDLRHPALTATSPNQQGVIDKLDILRREDPGYGDRSAADDANNLRKILNVNQGVSTIALFYARDDDVEIPYWVSCNFIHGLYRASGEFLIRGLMVGYSAKSSSRNDAIRGVLLDLLTDLNGSGALH